MMSVHVADGLGGKARPGEVANGRPHRRLTADQAELRVGSPFMRTTDCIVLLIAA